MKLKFILIILAHLGIANIVVAQSISNVQTTLDNNNIIISYNLEISEDVFISVYISENGGKTFSEPLNCVTGDVGFNVKSGSSRRIEWNVKEERGMLIGNNIVFRVKASHHGSMQDPRDGKTYKIVKIGRQIWIAENLSCKPIIGNYWAYDNDSSNIEKYGYLYDWQTALNACPEGWHLPSDSEWIQLADFCGIDVGAKLKSRIGWNNNGSGTDDYEFSALPGGYRHDLGSFMSLGSNGYWWTSTDYSSTNAWRRLISFDKSIVDRSRSYKAVGYSVRCLKD